MNSTMEEHTARFYFTRWKRLRANVATMFCIFAAMLFATGLVIGISINERPDMWFALAVIACLVMYLVLLIRLQIKYRYITRCNYVVSRDGISVEGDDGSYTVSWNDVDVAEYMPLVSVFRLSTKGHMRPIVLSTLELNGSRDPQTQRNRRASRYIRNGLTGRLKRRWFPW